jgi:hypothetical protein
MASYQEADFISISVGNKGTKAIKEEKKWNKE